MKEITINIPSELNAIFESLEYEEGDLIFNELKFVEKDVTIRFFIHLNDYKKIESQEWLMTVKDCIDVKIDLDNLSQYFHFFDEHFLLSEFKEVQTELYIKNRANNPEKLLADIYKLHLAKFNNLFPLEKLLNGGNLLTACNLDFGLFAKGPKSIIDEYYKVLKENNTNPYLFGELKPKKWNGEDWEILYKKYKLAVLGKTYFIGTDFIFTRIN